MWAPLWTFLGIDEPRDLGANDKALLAYCLLRRMGAPCPTPLKDTLAPMASAAVREWARAMATTPSGGGGATPAVARHWEAHTNEPPPPFLERKLREHFRRHLAAGGSGAMAQQPCSLRYAPDPHHPETFVVHMTCDADAKAHELPPLPPPHSMYASST